MNHASRFSRPPKSLEVRALLSQALPLVVALAGVLPAAGGPPVRAANLIVNPGFEDGTAPWGVFIPQESESKGCELIASKDHPHSGATCAEMKSTDFARFAILPKMAAEDFLKPGDRARLTFWIRTTQGVQTRGDVSFLVRMILVDDKGGGLPGAPALFVGLNGRTSVQSLESEFQPGGFEGKLPTAWTKVEAVFDVPGSPGASRLGSPGFFVQYAAGEIYLDDVALERVPGTTPLSATKSKP